VWGSAARNAVVPRVGFGVFVVDVAFGLPVVVPFLIVVTGVVVRPDRARQPLVKSAERPRVVGLCPVAIAAAKLAADVRDVRRSLMDRDVDRGAAFAAAGFAREAG
jgi:hypothetical protein